MLLYNNLLATTLYKKNVNTILRTHKSVDITDVHHLILQESDTLSLFLKRINQNAAKYEINPENTKHEDLSLELLYSWNISYKKIC